VKTRASVLKRVLGRLTRSASARNEERRLEVEAVQALLEQGMRCMQEGDSIHAIESFERAVALDPADATCRFNLGAACMEASLFDRAERCYREVLKRDASHANALNSLGSLLHRKGGNDDEAAQCYRSALEADREFGPAWFNLGVLEWEQGQHDQGIDCYRRALACEPDRADWHAMLAFAFRRVSRPLDALACFQEAMRIKPDWAVVQESLAGCLFEMGEAEEAVAAFRRACALDTGLLSAQSNLLFALNYVPGVPAEEVFRAHLDWARRQARTGDLLRCDNDANPERRLRVGYVSPDFRSQHPVAVFIEPVLARHDPEAVEVVCYADREHEDEFGERLRAIAGAWHRVGNWSNAQLAERIRSDRIDILVDLAGHSAAGRRMPLFAARRAPVQISWLGYLNTTGLDTIDYRITDRHACPEGWERYHSERLIRMPDSQWCYAPPAEAPPVGPLPARCSGMITFGSVHNFVKVSHQVIGVWARLLMRVPESRLLMIVPGSAQLADRIRQRFSDCGVPGDRIEILEQMAFADYLALHDRIDINLDAFPFSGGTTSCHSLWMGVPVVTLAGQSVVSRGGASLLRVTGLEELVAGTEEGYLDIAAALAGDIDRLEGLRRGLRERVARSPLVDAERFTRSLETAYREAWRSACAQAGRE